MNTGLTAAFSDSLSWKTVIALHSVVGLNVRLSIFVKLLMPLDVGHSPPTLNKDVGKVWRGGGFQKLFKHPSGSSDGEYWRRKTFETDNSAA